MELLACILVLIFVKFTEWTIKFVGYCFKLSFIIISLPFKMIFKPLTNNRKTEKSRSSSPNKYKDPIEKMEDHWDEHPEKLDMEDMFWLDELCGDD